MCQRLTQRHGNFIKTWAPRNSPISLARWLLYAHSSMSSFQVSKRMIILITLTLEMRQLMLREVNSPAQGYTAYTVSQGQSWDLNPDLSDAWTCSLNYNVKLLFKNLVGMALCIDRSLWETGLYRDTEKGERRRGEENKFQGILGTSVPDRF